MIRLDCAGALELKSSHGVTLADSAPLYRKSIRTVAGRRLETYANHIAVCVDCSIAARRIQKISHGVIDFGWTLRILE
jgi:hypothetical protein